MTTWNSRRATWIAVLIAALLIVLAVLQYRWLGELSEFEHQRMQSSLRAATERFRHDFDREIDELYYLFHIRRGRDAPDEIADEYEDWRTSFPFPDLIDTVFRVNRTREGELSIQHLNLSEGRFVDGSWPPVLEPLRNELREKTGRYNEDHERSWLTFENPLRSDIPALIIFQYDQRTPSWTIVVLRREVLVEQFLPMRVQEYYGSPDDLAYDIWIVDRSDGDRVVYSSNAASMPDLSEPDIERSIYTFDYAADRREGDERERHWTVVVRHQAGSLENAVRELRIRNLGVSFGIVLLVGASVFLLIVATRRAQRLAEQQMEFVAGVSHELRTPLAGISSLSQNLGDGVVRDLEQSRKYGRAIYRESRRLGQMVERVLQFSATSFGKHRYEMRPVLLPDLVRRAIATLGPDALEGLEIVTEFEEALPPVSADERALTSVLQNLLSNAAKFGAEGGKVRLVVRSHGTQAGKGGETGPGRERATAREVRLSIEDRGRGIPASEIPHIFKPFYRGKAARKDQVEGSGLGLSLVKEVIEAHGGMVTVESDEGSGTTFTLHLPVASLMVPGGSTPRDEPEESHDP